MKYLTGTRQTKYIVGSKRKHKPDYMDRFREQTGTTPTNTEHDYWQLQRNQETVGWDNLLRGKFAKDWRILNGEYNRKQNENEQETLQSHKAQEEIRKSSRK